MFEFYNYVKEKHMYMKKVGTEKPHNNVIQTLNHKNQAAALHPAPHAASRSLAAFSQGWTLLMTFLNYIPFRLPKRPEINS